MNVGEVIVQISVQIGALTAIGSALIWVYKKLVSEPDKRMVEKMQKEINEENARLQRENSDALKQSIEPLTKSIELLNYNLQDSQKDRLALHAHDEKQDKQIETLENGFFDHEKRISIIERTGDFR